MAIAACWPTAVTTFTIWRVTPRSKKCVTCCGTAGCRRARSWAICSRSWSRRGRSLKAFCGSAKSLPAGNAMDLLRTLTSALGHYDVDAADNSPQANYRKAVRITSQISSLVAAIGRMSKGLQSDRSGSGARTRGQFPLHADRRAPERPGDARLRRRADSACRPRAERLHLRGTCRRRHAHRHPLDHRRGDWHA